jgi:hypothetical protein
LSFGDQLDRELVKSSLKTIERLLPHGDETIDDGKFLTGVGLKFLERRFNIFFGFRESAGIGNRLRSCRRRRPELRRCKQQAKKAILPST